MVEEELNLTLDKNSVAEFEESFKEFNGNLKKSVEDLKEINSESVGLKDERMGVMLELSSRKLNVEQLANLSIQLYDYILTKRIGGSSEVPSYVG